MHAVGPLFPEQPDFNRHKPFRNKMTALEKGVADYFRRKGYEILGKHDDNPDKDPELLEQVVRRLEEQIKKHEGQLRG